MKKYFRFAAVAMILVLFTALLPMSASAADTFTLHANVPDTWADPGFYGWGGSLTMGWPGEAMTDEGNGWYSFEVPADATGLIVNANSGSSQTNDITGFEAKEMWVICHEDRTFELSYEQPVLTFTMNAYVPDTWADPCFYGWGGTALAMAWPGEAMTANGDGWYSFEVPCDAEGLIVNGNGGTVQTPDIKGFEARDMWVVVCNDTTFTISYEPIGIEQPEAVVSGGDAADASAEADTEPAGSSFFVENLWLFAIGAAVVAASGAAGAVLGRKSK